MVWENCNESAETEEILNATFPPPAAKYIMCITPPDHRSF